MTPAPTTETQAAQTAETKHTAGPWWPENEYDEDERGCAVIAANTDCGPVPGNPTRGMVAFVSELLPKNADRCLANARLIAAAPDLLEALRKLELAVLHNGDWDDGCFYHNGTSATELQGPLDAARAAIVKAEGRQS